MLEEELKQPKKSKKLTGARERRPLKALTIILTVIVTLTGIVTQKMIFIVNRQKASGQALIGPLMALSGKKCHGPGGIHLRVKDADDGQYHVGGNRNSY